jgi:hypothetical protein
MLSESARMSSAAEARFRIQAPNSKPRAVKVIALDAPSEGIVKRLAEKGWNGAAFFTASAFAGAPRANDPFTVGGWLSDLAGRTKNLLDEVRSADLVVMVATAGENAQAAPIIGDACRTNCVMTTVLILGSEAQSDEALATSLATLRHYAGMLVIAQSGDYIADMLIALRA